MSQHPWWGDLVQLALSGHCLDAAARGVLPGSLAAANIGAVGALAPQAAGVAVGAVLILAPQRRLCCPTVLTFLYLTPPHSALALCITSAKSSKRPLPQLPAPQHDSAGQTKGSCPCVPQVMQFKASCTRHAAPKWLALSILSKRACETGNRACSG